MSGVELGSVLAEVSEVEHTVAAQEVKVQGLGMFRV